MRLRHSLPSAAALFVSAFALAGLGLNSYRLRAKQWHPENEDVVRAMKVILTPEYQPVFVHCQAGKDRTGLFVAVYRIDRKSVV